MNIAVVGLSHKTATVEVREKLSVPEHSIDRAITALKAYPHIEEVAVISTCNRLEIYILTPETEAGILEVNLFLSERSQLDRDVLRPCLFVLLHEDAVMHLFRVAAGLDSLVLGEGQILAQVKTAHKQGQQHKGIGRVLNRLFKQALTTGKRVRSETSIGTGAVSISSAAVELAQCKAEHLANDRVAVLGAGKMARLLVQHLLSKGVSKIAVVNRSRKGAEELARQFPDASLSLHLMPEMPAVLAESDVVFASTGATEPIVDRAKLEACLPAGKPLMLLDIAVPRNVHSNVSELPHARVFNVDDLKEVVARNYESRRRIAQEAEGILEEELASFNAWWHSLETIPTINSLRDKIESIREQELEKALSRLGSEFTEKHREAIEALTRGIANKILHDPMVQLRAQQDTEARRQAMQSLQMLFNLGELQSS